MALVLLDRAKETTIVVGTTASAILLGAAPGYQSLAGVGNGNTTYYCIADQAGGLNWEVGLGTYTLATTTIARAATPLSSSNANASVSFPAGTKDVFIVYPSSKGVWLDASGNAIGLGTPAAFVATNVTGLPLTTGITGTLPVANGGTGVTTSTGTGSVVLNTSPTLVTPILGTPSSGTLTNCTLPQLSASTGSTLVGTINGGTGAVTRTVASKLNDTVSVKDFGAVGDGVTNDYTAIQNAINYAATLTAEYGPLITVDLVGGQYAVGSPLTVISQPSVVVANGKLIALSSLTATQYIIQFGGGTTLTRSVRSSIRDVFIECNFYCNGVSSNANTGARNSNLIIHGFTNYGYRVWNNGGDCVHSGFRITKYWFDETGFDLKANRTGSALSIEDADHIFTNIITSYCKYPLYLGSFYNIQLTSCHFYNGAISDLVRPLITGVANNAGSIRVTVDSTTGIVNNDLVTVPYLSGLTTSVAGVYVASNVTATTIDFTSYPFAGTYTGTDQHLVLWADESISVYAASTAKNAIFANCYFDSGKIYINDGAILNIGSSYFTGNQTTANRTVGAELISDAITSAQFNGIIICGTLSQVDFIRFTCINGGTVSNNIGAVVSLNNLTDTRPADSVGAVTVPQGSAAFPALRFAYNAPTQNGSLSVVSDVNTGFYHPSLDYIGCSTGGSPVWIVDDSQRMLFGVTTSFPISNTQSKIQVAGTGVGATTFAISSFAADATTSACLFLAKSRNATAGDVTTAAGQVLAGDSLGKISWCGQDGAGGMGITSRVAAYATANFTSGAKKSEIVFETTTGTTQTKRVRVDENGNLSPYITNAYSLGLAATYSWANIYSQNALTITSDSRAKANIIPTPLGLDFINKLNPVSYTFKVGSNEHTVNIVEEAVYDEEGNLLKEEVTEDVVTPVVGKRVHYGLIAQEVQAVIEEEGVDFGGWVLGDVTDAASLQALRYEEFIAPLIKAVQELTAKVAALESK